VASSGDAVEKKVPYEELDPKVALLVRVLNEKVGLTTISSCQGHIGRSLYCCPEVIIGIFRNASAASKIRRLIAQWNNSSGKRWILTTLDGDDEERPLLLYLRPEEKNYRQSSKILLKLQEEAEELAKFLEKRS
jgi:hypothetical protein